MIINYPITDYIKQSILTTKGDLVVEGVTDPERLAAAAVDLYLKSQGAGATPIYEALALRNTGVFIGQSTRSTGGSEVITGVGFKPSVVIFLSVDSTPANLNWSIGFANTTIDHLIRVHSNGTAVGMGNTLIIDITRDGSNYLYAGLTSMDSDGFTLTWTLAGATGINYKYLCLP